MTSPTISVVIINFDGEARLPGVLEAVAKSTVEPDEILVVDDASRDGSLLWLRHFAKSVRVVVQPKNRGPAAARSLGLRSATGDLVLFLDNDARPRPEALENLRRAFQDHVGLAAAQPRIVLETDPPVVQCDGGIGHPTGQMALVTSHVPLDRAGSVPPRITSLMSTALLVDRRRALAAGGFADDFFMFFEDHEFGFRLSLQGAELESVPSALIDHGTGTTGLSLRAGGVPTERRVYLQTRNRWLCLLRTWSGRSMRRLAPLLLLHEIAQAGFWAARGHGGAYVDAMLRVGSEGARTLRARAEIQAHRVVPDRRLIHAGPLPLHPGALPKTGVAVALVGVCSRGLEWLGRALCRTL